MKKYISVFCFILFLGTAQFTFASQTLGIHDFAIVGNANENRVANGAQQFCKGNYLLNQQQNQFTGVFNDVDCDFCEAGGGQGTVQVIADNFNLTTANSFYEVVIYGGYFPDNIPLANDIWTVNVHADDGGLPGTILYSETSVAYTRETTGVVLFGVDEYRYVLSLATPVSLSAGTYWIEIHGDSSGSTETIFWETANLGTNSILGSGFAFEYPAVTWAADTEKDFALQICEESYNINVNVSGLAASNSVSLSNGGDNLTVSTDGTEVLSTLTPGTGYNISVSTHPDTPDQVCSITSGNGTGTVTNSDITVDVSCVTTQYNVQVNVSGLAATNSVSFSNGGDNLTISNNGTQTISTLDDGSAFDVNITAQPDTPNQVCSFTNAASGNLAGGDATVNVSCLTTQYNVGVIVSGLAAGNSVILQNNGGDNLTVNNDGSSNFATALDDGSAYNVTVLTQPTTPNQTCVVSSPSGNLAGSDVALAVSCTTNSYNVQISVVGLAATNSVSFSNGGDNLTISNDGTQTISTLLDESAYDVSITTQPVTPNQDCIFTVASAGTIAGADVTLSVECSTYNYFVGGTVGGLVNGNELALDLNNVQVDLVYCDGAFVFPAPILDGSSYSVTVLLNPSNPSQNCDVTSGSGTMNGGDVIDVSVSCAATVDIDYVFRGGFDCMPIF